MTSVCFYFQVHQPFRMKKYSIFNVGDPDYFDRTKNIEIINKVKNKCYLPANKIFLDLIHKQDGDFKISYSISGMALEQFEEYAPEVIQSFKDLVDTGCVEMLDETHYHSLAFLHSKDEFKAQVKLHTKKIKELFKVTPKIFRNTELIFNNELANYVEGMGYKGVLAEGADKVLGWRSPNYLYTAKTSKIKLLLKNYKLSDDIAFRFSNKGWEGWPLTADKFTDWISKIQGDTINLFMDYETFGEHQWEDTGIFNFLKHMPQKLLNHDHINFKTPTEVAESYEPVAELDIHNPMSWADTERDTSAWTGNSMQDSAQEQIYAMRDKVIHSNNKNLIHSWRKLQTSDHFYYMCTKWFSDGDVHKYFNPYDSPYDSFISYMNILTDLNKRLIKNGNT